MTRFSALLISTFLISCQAGGTPQSAPETPPDVDLASVERGAAVYADMCSSCHGDNLSGGLAPSLADDTWSLGGTDADILNIIKHGNDDVGMPGFEGALSDADGVDLLAYIRAGDDTAETTAPVDQVQSVESEVVVKDWVTGLDEPWAIVFTADGDALITEKTGTLRQVKGGTLLAEPVAGIPLAYNQRQAGLLDVAIDPEYDNNGWVYFSFSHPLESDPSLTMTAIVRGRISEGVWADQEWIFKAKPEDYLSTSHHYGSRITFDDAGHLFFSVGDRGHQDIAQDVSKPNGKIHRVNRDGSIPSDNPFAGRTDAYASIYAYGNRNPQGLIIHPETQTLWETEHGPRGGDELNVITSGTNYGWPKISYGINYNGTVLTPHTALPGMAQPISQWTPSIAVCGLDVYTGDLFPNWKGRLMAGALAFETVRLIDVSGGEYGGEVTLIKDKGRVRDVTTGPDGAIYVALPKKIVRITPHD